MLALLDPPPELPDGMERAERLRVRDDRAEVVADAQRARRRRARRVDGRVPRRRGEVARRARRGQEVADPLERAVARGAERDGGALAAREPETASIVFARLLNDMRESGLGWPASSSLR